MVAAAADDAGSIRMVRVEVAVLPSVLVATRNGVGRGLARVENIHIVWRRSSEIHLIGDPHRTLGEPVVYAASAVVVVSGEPADERPSALPCEFGQRGDELVGDSAAAKFGIDEEIVEETDGAAG